MFSFLCSWCCSVNFDYIELAKKNDADDETNSAKQNILAFYIGIEYIIEFWMLTIFTSFRKDSINSNNDNGEC